MIKSVLIDNREPLHVQNLTFGNIPVAITQLQTGDLWVACADGATLIIERKSLGTGDFFASIKDNRLFNQVASMRKISQWSYVAIEGWFTPHAGDTIWATSDNPDGQLTGWKYNAIQGVLLSIMNMGVGVIHYTGRNDFKSCIERLAKRSRSDVKIPPVRQPYVFSPQEALLATLPGIGSKRAIEYLKLFQGNLALALMALTASHNGKINPIPGYGKKSRDNVVEFLGGMVDYKTDE